MAAESGEGLHPENRFEGLSDRDVVIIAAGDIQTSFDKLSRRFDEIVKWRKKLGQRTLLAAVLFAAAIAVGAFALHTTADDEAHQRSVTACNNARNVRFEQDIARRSALSNEANDALITFIQQVTNSTDVRQFHQSVTIYINRIHQLDKTPVPVPQGNCS